MKKAYEKPELGAVPVKLEDVYTDPLAPGNDPNMNGYLNGKAQLNPECAPSGFVS